MSIESQPAPEIPSTIPDPPGAEPTPAERGLLAPVWHTLLVVGILVGNSYFTARLFGRALQHGPILNSHQARLFQYGATIVLEFFLLAIVWLGLRTTKTTIRDLIGGKWNTPEDFLIDMAITAGFWVTSALILAGLGYLMGLSSPAQVNEMKQRMGGLMPQIGFEMVVWVLLSCTAGFVEEIIFRGYLQRQIGAMAGNIYVGLGVSAIIFGAGHGYEGARRMVLIALYGAMFGMLALWRKSLRPGMIAHAWQDAFAGISYRLLEKFGRLSLT
jgi:membrane protease YdiL (CAAX protease family)